jgi:hypothetical protein
VSRRVVACPRFPGDENKAGEEAGWTAATAADARRTRVLQEEQAVSRRCCLSEKNRPKKRRRYVETKEEEEPRSCVVAFPRKLGVRRKTKSRARALGQLDTSGDTARVKKRRVATGARSGSRASAVHKNSRARCVPKPTRVGRSKCPPSEK